MPSRAAVLDLGTNTFHLLVAERNFNGNLVFLHREERWVFLAEDGIDRIGPGAFARMAAVLKDYAEVIAHFKPNVTRATGTAAFRSAANSDDARALVKRFIGIEPEVISGNREAQLIYRGVRLSASSLNGAVLVQDIGGGSTEYIIGYGNDILWKKSYPLGATLLRQRFHKSEPIASHEIDAIQQHVLSLTDDLAHAVSLHQPVAFIGSSGSFDSFAAMLMHPEEPPARLIRIDADALNALVDKIVVADEPTRKAMPGLVWFRVGPVVTAALLTRFVLQRFGFRTVYRSPYALKEGLMALVLEETNLE